jgi:hypothetical protein
MDDVIHGLLFLHFLGLAMGFSTSFGNIVMAGLIDKAAPAERAVLGRFPPAMSRVGTIGIALLWASGLGMVMTKWGGLGNIGNMPWQFHVKLTLVVILTVLITYLHALERRMRTGDTSGMARLQALGKVAFLLALAIVAFAVLSFD